jgi:hypothetical protein
MTLMPKNFSCCMTRIASAMSRANARAVVDEQNIEWFSLLGRRSEQALHAGTVWMLAPEIPASVWSSERSTCALSHTASRPQSGPARGVSLEVAGVSGVHGYTHFVLPRGGARPSTGRAPLYLCGFRQRLISIVLRVAGIVQVPCFRQQSLNQQGHKQLVDEHAQRG